MEATKQRKYGIEIEVSRRLVNVHCKDRAHNKAWTELSNGLKRLRSENIIKPWKLKIDTSCGGEIVSPILIGKDGLREMAEICMLINNVANKFETTSYDAECGLHIHLDAAGMTPKQMSNLFALIYMAEPIIYAMYPYRNPRYCAPIEIDMEMASSFRSWPDVRDVWYRGTNNVKNRATVYRRDFINSQSAGDNYDGTRYHGFNIHCYWRQGTVEFRYGAGTTDPLHIKAYYEMCLALMERAMIDKPIKLSKTIRRYGYSNLFNHYLDNHRFRNVIQRLCEECAFTKDTIRLISDLIRKNNPDFLSKDGDDIVLVDRHKEHLVVFKTPDGRMWDMSGADVQRVSMSEKILVNADYEWESMADSYVPLKISSGTIMRRSPPAISKAKITLGADYAKLIGEI